MQRLASSVVTDILGLGVGVLISWGCHIKLLQSRKLKMMELYSLRVLESTDMTKSVSRVAVGGEFFPFSASLWWMRRPVASLWQKKPNLRLYLHVAALSVSVLLCVSYKDTCYWIWGPPG